MSIHRSLLAVPLIALAACATSQPSRTTEVKVDDQTVVASADGQKADAEKKQDKDKEVCTYERVVGSNLPRRICRPQSVIDRERRSAEDTMTRIRLSPRPSDF